MHVKLNSIIMFLRPSINNQSFHISKHGLDPLPKPRIAFLQTLRFTIQPTTTTTTTLSLHAYVHRETLSSPFLFSLLLLSISSIPLYTFLSINCLSLRHHSAIPSPSFPLPPSSCCLPNTRLFPPCSAVSLSYLTKETSE